MRVQYPGPRDEKEWLQHSKALGVFVATVADLNEKCVLYRQALSASILGVASSPEDDGTRWQNHTNFSPD